jgi:hypothetical protein
MISRSSHQRKRLSKSEQRQRKQRQARKARVTRRQLACFEQHLPKQARDLLGSFAPAFTRPTFLRFVVLTCAVILTLGSRTVCNLLRTLGALAPGHPSSYHRVFSKCRWSAWRLAYLLANWIFSVLLPQGPLFIAGDDTVDEHPGKKVYGKGCHRDPVRSTHSYTAYRWGHKWVVLAVLVRFPFTSRRWALPILVALYRTKADNLQHRRRHKTPAKILQQLLRMLLRWFPARKFICAADGNYATHELAKMATHCRERLVYVSHFYSDANLYEPPPVMHGKKPAHRPRQKGDKLPTPQQSVANAKRTHLNVAWYGGGRREVDVVTDTGQWYRSGHGLVPVRWVFVHDCTGTHRDEYFFTTDLGMGVSELIEIYTGRWNLETTFEELRSYLGLETTRGWCRQTILREPPCLFGLYSLVAVLYTQLPRKYARVRVVDWPGKQAVTFSDAITAVRRWLWQEWVLAIPGHRQAFSKLTRPFRQILLNGLAPAA